jgi:hypothetical protein
MRSVRACGESEVRGDARAETRFHFRTDITSVVPWLVVSEMVAVDLAITAGRWLVWSQSSSAVGDLPTTRDEISSPRSASAPPVRTEAAGASSSRFVVVPGRPKRAHCQGREVGYRNA